MNTTTETPRTEAEIEAGIEQILADSEALYWEQEAAGRPSLQARWDAVIGDLAKAVEASLLAGQ